MTTGDERWCTTCHTLFPDEETFRKHMAAAPPPPAQPDEEVINSAERLPDIDFSMGEGRHRPNIPAPKPDALQSDMGEALILIECLEPPSAGLWGRGYYAAKRDILDILAAAAPEPPRPAPVGESKAVAARIADEANECCSRSDGYREDIEKLVLDALDAKDREIERLRAHMDILVDALAEIKATSDGESDQPIADIIKWCLEQVGELPARSSATKQVEAMRKAAADRLERRAAVVEIRRRFSALAQEAGE